MFISLQSYHHNVWAIRKEIKDAYPKKVCHTPTRCVKKREREREKGKYSPYQKHYKGKRIHIKEFSSIIHQKYPHTCTSWSRLITCFSFGSGLWLSKMWEAGCLYTLHTYRSTKKKPLEVGWKKRKAHKKGLVRNETHWAIREITRGTYQFLFKNYIKPPDWRLNKGVVSETLQAVLTLNRQRWEWCYKPHRSKVKRCKQGQLIQNKGKNTRLCLGHKSGMRHL